MKKVPRRQHRLTMRGNTVAPKLRRPASKKAVDAVFAKYMPALDNLAARGK